MQGREKEKRRERRWRQRRSLERSDRSDGKEGRKGGGRRREEDGAGMRKVNRSGTPIKVTCTGESKLPLMYRCPAISGKTRSFTFGCVFLYFVCVWTESSLRIIRKKKKSTREKKNVKAANKS